MPGYSNIGVVLQIKSSKQFSVVESDNYGLENYFLKVVDIVREAFQMKKWRNWGKVSKWRKHHLL